MVESALQNTQKLKIVMFQNFIFELENDSWNHIIEALNNIIKYKK
jgi:hypothetical protein